MSQRTVEPNNALGLLDATDPPPPYQSTHGCVRVFLPAPPPRPAESTPLLHPPWPPRRPSYDSEPDHAVDIFEALGSHPADDPVRRVAPARLSNARACDTYFRPMRRRAYHAAVFHLLVLNLPYALVAWLYLFVFTLTGTTLLITLPLGALLCFLDLLGARAFARGELALQTAFYGPLAPPLQYPIFKRPRSLDAAAAEAALPGIQYEPSFYKNTYAMVTDATTYQALFYFLVIKPGVTLCLFIPLLVLVPLSYVLVLPAPLMLRFVRKLGVWQANIAVEGLYYQLA